MPVLQIDKSPLRAIWKITETFPELMELLHSNDEEIRINISAINNEVRKKECVAVRLLLKHLLEKDLQLLHHKDGSPYLSDGKLHISISHTKGYAAIVLSGTPNPGIDIEYCSERAFHLKERFLSSEELDLLDEEKPVSPAVYATLFWCAKETVFKSLKREGVDFIKHLHILNCSAEENSGVLTMKETKTPKKQFFSIAFEITDDYVLTWKK